MSATSHFHWQASPLRSLRLPPLRRRGQPSPEPEPSVTDAPAEDSEQLRQLRTMLEQNEAADTQRQKVLEEQEAKILSLEEKLGELSAEPLPPAHLAWALVSAPLAAGGQQDSRLAAQLSPC